MRDRFSIWKASGLGAVIGVLYLVVLATAGSEALPAAPVEAGAYLIGGAIGGAFLFALGAAVINLIRRSAP